MESGQRFAVLVLQKYVEGADIEEQLREYTDRMLYLIERVGGRIAWSGRPVGVVAGDSTNSWDVVIIVEYPTPEAAMRLTSDPEYIEAMEARSAAVDRVEIHACIPVIDAPR